MELPFIFDPSFGRTYPTMWCTLGYFDHDDFKVTDEIRHTFEQICTNLELVIDIDKVEIVEFPKKSFDQYCRYGSPIFL